MTFKKFAAIASVTTLVGTTAYAEPLPVNEYLNVTPTAAPFSISLGVTFAKTDNYYMDPHYYDSMSDSQIETISTSVATGGQTAVSNATASMNMGQGMTSSNGGATSGAALNSVVHTMNGGFESIVGTPAEQPLP